MALTRLMALPRLLLMSSHGTSSSLARSSLVSRTALPAEDLMIQLTEIVKAQLVFYDARCDERHKTRLTDEDYDDEAEEKMTEEEEFENENIRQVKTVVVVVSLALSLSLSLSLSRCLLPSLTVPLSLALLITHALIFLSQTHSITQVGDLIHTLFGNAGVGFLRYFNDLLPHVVKMLQPFPVRTHCVHHLAISIFDDLVEYCGPRSFEYAEHFAEAMVAYLSDPQPELRQACAYGIGVCALHGGEA